MPRQRIRTGIVLAGVWLAAVVIASGTVQAAPPRGDRSDSEQGLRQMFTDLVERGRAGDTAGAATLAASLKLPEPTAWFTEVFGQDLGRRLAAGYARETEDLGTVMAAVVGKQVQAGRTEVHVRRLDRPGDEATGLQNDALKAMKRPTSLYSVRLVKPGESTGFHLWSFALVDGKYRFLGKMAAAGTR